jgi:hypothetical protein
MPYAITSQSGGLNDSDNPNSGFEDRPVLGNAGIGLKYDITPNLTLDFAYNPDFSQVESDERILTSTSALPLFWEIPLSPGVRITFGTPNLVQPIVIYWDTRPIHADAFVFEAHLGNGRASRDVT